MNKWGQVASMFGLELNEYFYIVHNSDRLCGCYSFSSKGLIDRGELLKCAELVNLLNGEYKVSKMPFIPKISEDYYCIRFEGSSWFVERHTNKCSDFDSLRISLGNCFKHEEDITDEHIKKWKEFCTSPKQLADFMEL